MHSWHAFPCDEKPLSLAGPHGARALAVEIGLQPRMVGCQHRLDRPRRDDPSARERGDSVAHCVKAVKIVSYHENRQPQSSLKRGDEVVELAGSDRVEA